MSRDIWLISDTHFGYNNIIKFVNKDGFTIRQRRETFPVPGEDPMKVRWRPFKDIHEHNQYLTERWNSVVKPQDHVWHGGDFGVFQAKRHLNGVINLIVGNHDEDFQHYVNGEEYDAVVELTPGTRTSIRRRCPGFKKIRDSRLWGEQEHHVAGLKFLQTHRPINMLRGGDPFRKFQFNVHGHTHGHKVQFMGSEDPLFYNISVECLDDYTPVHIEDVAKELKKRRSQDGTFIYR